MKKFFSRHKGDIVILVILFIFLIYLQWNMFSNPYIGSSNDMEPHAYKLWYLKESLVNYHKIPSWTSDQFGGRPFLGLYQPLTYYLLLPISIMFSPINVTKVSMILINFIAILFFYFLAKRIFKNKYLVLMGTALFMVHSMRLVATATSAFAQLTAMTFVPIVFLVYEKNKEKFRLRYLALISLFVGLCLLTHHAVGGTLFGVMLIFLIYDYVIGDRKGLLKLIPFLLLSILIALVFLVPAYLIQDTLNFGVTEAAGKAFRPLSYTRFFNRSSEHFGIIGAIVFLFSLFHFIKKKNLKNIVTKYVLASFVLVLIGLYLHSLIPNFIKGTLQGGHRFFSVLGTTLPITFMVGIKCISKYLTKFIKKFNIFSFRRKGSTKIIRKVLFVIIFILLLLNFGRMKTPKSTFNVPAGVLEFYEEISKDKEYYRLEDQSFTPFGSSPIFHKHGILNGAPMQEASKYHFFFWNAAWKLLDSPFGLQNFAGLYGTLSIKYFVFKGQTFIPYLKEIKRGDDYVIYENEKFLSYVRLVPNSLVAAQKEPYHFQQFLDFIGVNDVHFDRLVFVHSNKLIQDRINLNAIIEGKVDLLEKKPDYLKVEVSDIDKKTYLVIAESYHPYWKAYQNGKELKIHEGIPSTLVIPIEDNGVIELKYIPPRIRKILFYVTIITILGLIGLIIYDIKRYKNK